MFFGILAMQKEEHKIRHHRHPPPTAHLLPGSPRTSAMTVNPPGTPRNYDWAEKGEKGQIPRYSLWLLPIIREPEVNHLN